MKIGGNVSFRIPICLDRIFTWPVTWYRRFKYGYTFRKIYLGEDEWTILDQQDYYRLGNFKWCLDGAGTQFYALRSIKVEPKRTKTVYLHREIMQPPPGLVVDHKNGDGLDNRRANLRLATRSQNMFNRPKTRRKTSSRFIGVYLDKCTRRWAARIEYQRKSRWLGRFKTELDAARAYDEAAKKYHKEFARLNFE